MFSPHFWGLGKRITYSSRMSDYLMTPCPSLPMDQAAFAEYYQRTRDRRQRVSYSRRRGGHDDRLVQLVQCVAPTTPQPRRYRFMFSTTRPQRSGQTGPETQQGTIRVLILLKVVVGLGSNYTVNTDKLCCWLRDQRPSLPVHLQVSTHYGRSHPHPRNPRPAT